MWDLVAKLGNNKTANMEILTRIWDYFEYRLEDIVSYNPKLKKLENKGK